MNILNKPTLIFTGGHHTSALVVAKILINQGWQIIWFGHRHSMWKDSSETGEYKEVTASGIPFYEIKAGKFYHTFNPRKLLRIPLGFIQTFVEIKRIKSNLTGQLKGIVSFGGYLAVPAVCAGKILGIPSITHEQTVVAGWANKLISLFVNKIAVSWPTNFSHYPADKVVLTGLPLRPEILKLTSHKQAKNNKPTIYFTGGKQGSHVINQVIFSCLNELQKTYRVIHQTGSSTLYNDYATAKSLLNSNYQAFDYDNFQGLQALEASDVVVSRAGAHICYELAVLGKRSVLIPIPWSSHHEQMLNAQLLVSFGQSILLTQEKLNPNNLLNSISSAFQLKPSASPLPLDGAQQLADLIKSSFNE